MAGNFAFTLLAEAGPGSKALSMISGRGFRTAPEESSTPLHHQVVLVRRDAQGSTSPRSAASRVSRPPLRHREGVVATPAPPILRRSRTWGSPLIQQNSYFPGPYGRGRLRASELCEHARGPSAPRPLCRGQQHQRSPAQGRARPSPLSAWAARTWLSRRRFTLFVHPEPVGLVPGLDLGVGAELVHLLAAAGVASRRPRPAIRN